MLINCKFCNKEFTKRKKTSKFCCKDCVSNYRNSFKKEIKCKLVSCNNIFIVSSNAKYNKEFCSSSCAASYNNEASPKRSKMIRCELCNELIPCYLRFCEEHSPDNSRDNIKQNIYIINCKYCHKEFDTKISHKKFCNKSCASLFYKKNGEIDNYHNDKCPHCKNKKSPNSITCAKCHVAIRKQKKIDSWLNGEWSGGSNVALSEAIRNYLLEEANYSCSKCGFNTPHPDDNKTILEINHIDGDGSHHNKKNLEVLCPNCHALTSNYRGRNIGNGRKQHYIRVTA